MQGNVRLSNRSIVLRGVNIPFILATKSEVGQEKDKRFPTPQQGTVVLHLHLWIDVERERVIYFSPSSDIPLVLVTRYQQEKDNIDRIIRRGFGSRYRLLPLRILTAQVPSGVELGREALQRILGIGKKPKTPA